MDSYKGNRHEDTKKRFFQPGNKVALIFVATLYLDT